MDRSWVLLFVVVMVVLVLGAYAAATGYMTLW
jgi:hypothetical protein